MLFCFWEAAAQVAPASDWQLRPSVGTWCFAQTVDGPMPRCWSIWSLSFGVGWWQRRFHGFKLLKSCLPPLGCAPASVIESEKKFVRTQKIAFKVTARRVALADRYTPLDELPVQVRSLRPVEALAAALHVCIFVTLRVHVWHSPTRSLGVRRRQRAPPKSRPASECFASKVLAKLKLQRRGCNEAKMEALYSS